MSVEDKFIQQLSGEYESGLKDRDSLDTRSFAMITISATTTTLLNGFAIALLSKISSSYIFFNYIIISLAIGIILTIGSIMVFISVSRSIDYAYIFGGASSIFFKESSESKEGSRLNNDMIDRFKRATEQEFNDLIIRDYLECIKHNQERNLNRRDRIFAGQWVYVIDVIVILLSIGLQLHAVLIHAIV